MSTWRAMMEEVINRAKQQLAELNRLYLRLDARMGGVEAHVENLYREIKAMRQDLSATTEQARQTTDSLVRALDLVVRTNSAGMTLSEKVLELDARVSALEQKG